MTRTPPTGVHAVSFVEIYLNSFAGADTSGDSDVLSDLPTGEHLYKVAGTGMSGGRSATGTLPVLP